MDQVRYAALCLKLEGKVISFDVSFMELTTMLGAIQVLEDHPDFLQLAAMKEITQGIRNNILDAMLRLGVPLKDLDAMNTLYASSIDEIREADRKLTVIEFPGEEDEK